MIAASPTREAAVAHFFKYKSVADLEAENARLGIDLRFSDDLSPLSARSRIGRLTVGNRWCIHPMEGCDGEPDGSAGRTDVPPLRPLRRRRGEAHLGRGVRRHRGGPGQPAANLAQRATPRRLRPDGRRLPRRPTAAANGDDSDLLIGLQLTHSGRYSYPRPIIATHDPLLDPRTVADKATGATVTPTTRSDRRRTEAAGRSLRRGGEARRRRSGSTSST